MIFFLNLDGTMSKADEQRIFQGSSNANKISVVSPFLPPTALQIAFTLPNKLTTIYYPMSFDESYEPSAEQPSLKVGLWSYKLPLMITENEGTVGVSVNVNVAGADAVESNQTSYTSSFEVEYSVLPAPPLNPTTSDVETLVNLLNAYYAQNQYLIEYGRIGTVIHVGSLVQGGESGGVVRVSNAELASESNENDLYINLSGNLYTCTASNPTAGTSDWSYKTNIKGPKGDKGDKGEQGIPGINNALLQNAQGASTNDGMTQDAITKSCFARVYRSFADIDPSFNGYTEITTLCDAMINNSILITSMELDDSPIYPLNDGILTVMKRYANRVVLNYTRKTYNATTCLSWNASVTGVTGESNRFSGWVQTVDSVNAQTIGGIKTFTNIPYVLSNNPFYRGIVSNYEYSDVPQSTQYYGFEMMDKNRVWFSSFRTTFAANYNAADIGLRGKNNTTYALRLGATTSGAYFIPTANNTIQLGQASNQWKELYAVEIYENGVSLKNKYTDNPFNREWSSGTLGSVRLPSYGTYQIKGGPQSENIGFIIEHNGIDVSPLFFNTIGIAMMYVFNIDGNGTVTANAVTTSGVGDSLSGVIYYRKLN